MNIKKVVLAVILSSSSPLTFGSDIDVVRLLLENGADDERSYQADDERSYQFSQIDVVRLLLENGADDERSYQADDERSYQFSQIEGRLSFSILEGEIEKAVSALQDVTITSFTVDSYPYLKLNFTAAVNGSSEEFSCRGHINNRKEIMFIYMDECKNDKYRFSDGRSLILTYGELRLRQPRILLK